MNVLAAALLTLGACTTDLPGAWVPTDIDISERLERIGDKAYSMLCNTFSDHVHDVYRSQLLIEAACTAHALQTTSNASECAQVTAECLDTLPAPVEDQLQTILAQASCKSVGVTSSGCGSVVSDLVECLDAIGSKVSQLKLSATCAAFGSPPPPDWWRLSVPDACMDLVSRCHAP